MGIAIGPGSELADRAPLTSVPSAIGLGMPYRGQFTVETFDLGADGSETPNGDIFVSSTNAQIGLNSDAGGSYGSGIQMSEVAGGALTSKWSIVRDSSVQRSWPFTHGADPRCAINPTQVAFDTEAGVTAASFTFATSNVGYISSYATDFGEVISGNRSQWPRLVRLAQVTFEYELDEAQ